jgi:hypothetical protein
MAFVTLAQIGSWNNSQFTIKALPGSLSSEWGSLEAPFCLVNHMYGCSLLGLHP